MVPRQARLGRSFKGAGAYYLHDKDADTSERVAFTATFNVPTQDPEKALKWMAWTAIHAEELKRESGVSATGQPCTKPVFSFSLAWHPDEQEPVREEMIGAGRRALIALGLEAHETLLVAHRETDHPHIHLIVNTVHPETGRVNTLPFSKLTLSKWAEEYEREHGKIYCEQRVENNEQRERGEFVKYQEPEVDHKSRISELYHASDSGRAFQEALADAGYKLAQGKRILVIDQTGAIHSLSRQIDGVKAKDIRTKLADIVLQPIDEARAQLSSETEQRKDVAERREPDDQTPKNQRAEAQEEVQPVYFDRDQQNTDWEESIFDAAIEADEARPPQAEAEPLPQSIPSRILNALQDRQLEELGRFSTDKTLARLHLEAQLDDFYGVDERQMRADIARLEHTLNNSGRFKRLWLKLTGRIPKDADKHLGALRVDLENVAKRKKEASEALEYRTQIERQALETRHQRERDDLEPTVEPSFDDERYDAENPEPEEDIGPSLDY